MHVSAPIKFHYDSYRTEEHGRRLPSCTSEGFSKNCNPFIINIRPRHGDFTSRTLPQAQRELQRSCETIRPTLSTSMSKDTTNTSISAVTALAVTSSDSPMVQPNGPLTITFTSDSPLPSSTNTSESLVKALSRLHQHLDLLEPGAMSQGVNFQCSCTGFHEAVRLCEIFVKLLFLSSSCFECLLG